MRLIHYARDRAGVRERRSRDHLYRRERAVESMCAPVKQRELVITRHYRANAT